MTLGQCIVYQVTNTVNGKRYIGITSRALKDRFGEHKKATRRGSNLSFHSAMRKYGVESFVPKVLFVEESVEGAKETEVLLILDRQPEYNETMGGDGINGYVFTDEIREKIRRNTPVRSGKDHPLYGVSRPDTAEMNRKRKGIKNPNLARKGENHPFYGKSRTEETRNKIGASNRGKFVSEDTRAKQSASAKARSKTEEGRANASIAGRKGAEARWSKHRAAKETAQNSEV